MAENLDDGEFWLPSQFLTDDDILEDFKSEGFLSGFGSDLTTETETSDDDDILLPGFINKANKNLPSTGSPQSTLYGWEYATRQGSSQGSPSPQQKETRAEAGKEEKNENEATLDLLNKAAGEVAKMKMRSERSNGTGFFDCSNSGKGLLCPPPLQTQPLPQRPLPVFQPPFYSYPHFRFPPHMMYGPVQIPPPQQPRQVQNRVTKNNTTNNKSNTKTNNVSIDRPLGLPPSAWPPLPGQAQPQTTQPQPQSKAQPQIQQPQAQPMMSMYAVPSVGTGVFLPRVVPATSDSKKKSDAHVMKTKNNKGSQKRNARLTKANNVEEIKLPSEWVY